MSDVGRFRRVGLAGVAVAVAVLVAVVLAIAVATNGRDDDPDATPTSSPSASPSVDTADASVCGLDGFEETDTLDRAPETEWELVGTVAAPTDPLKTGPGIEEEGFRRCFERTAEGALFAAVNWFALSSDARNLSRLAELVEPGRGREAAIAAASSSTLNPSETRLQVAGFRINTYDGSEAVVDLAWTVTSEDNSLVSFPTALRWSEGDWKIVLTDEGLFPYAAAPISNLGGYTPWRGI